jgi:hypothetical protein
VTLDDQLTLDAHAKSIFRDSFYQLRQLRNVQRSLRQEARRVLVTAFIASRVDYTAIQCSTAWQSAINRLQICLNAAARLVTGFKEYILSHHPDAQG